MNSRYLLLFACLLLTTRVASAADRIVSRYTSTAKGKAISFKVHEDEPGGGFEGVFAGLGGYRLVHLSGDDRSWLNVRYGKKTVDLYEKTMKAGPGSFPRKANDVVEWRGVERDGRFQPYAIIYRLEGNDDEKRRTKTRLIVIKLDPENSKVIGFAQGVNEDAKARAIADGSRR